jgi:hypothetical protein
MLKFIAVASAVVLVGVGVGVISAQKPDAKPAESSKQFVLMVYETAEEFALRTDTTEKGKAYWQQWGGFMESMTKAGITRGGAPLQREATSRTLTLQNGQPNVAKAAGNDKLEWTGFFLIEVKDLDEALAWAAKVPNAATSKVEIRCVDHNVPAMPKDR